MSTCCPLCRSPRTDPFFSLPGMPVSIGILWPSATQARACPRGDLSLVFCRACGFVWNRAFDPSLLAYSERYNNSLEFSPVFQDYARGLARRLVDAYGIRGKDVVELGCGEGYFLSTVCEAGGNRGVGFDPSWSGRPVESPSVRDITCIKDYYGEQYSHIHGDLVCCRHVFEHIPEPLAFLSMVGRTMRARRSGIAYFEVPDIRFILEGLSIWDIIFEHCNYFSAESLSGVFRRCGFEVLRVDSAYGGQFLSLDARLADAPDGPAAGEDLAGLTAAAERFADQVLARSRQWQTRLAALRRDGRRVVVWGGGAKTVSFLNMLETGDTIPYAVDINSGKQGRYLPGTGQQIVSPDFLQTYRPHTVVLMNPIYRREVEAQLHALGVDAEVIPA